MRSQESHKISIAMKYKSLQVFDSDLWREVIFTVSQQKMRSLMTMFGVFWGIFMLIILVGCSFGFAEGIIGQITSLESNTLFLFPSSTTVPYDGYDRDRRWKFRSEDVLMLQKLLSGRLENIMMTNTDYSVSLKHNIASTSGPVLGITPNYSKVVPQRVVEGRYINHIDISQHRKVCLIGADLSKILFEDESPLGEIISIAGVMHTVVGVVKSTNDNIQLGANPTEAVLLPITTEQDVMNHRSLYDFITITNLPTHPVEQDRELIVRTVKKLHHIAPADDEAIDVFNLKAELAGYLGIELGINILIWIIGIGTLAAGLIGITNIMIVTIKERTQEIGVRRALGAMPSQIIQQIMMESLTLTLTAGIAGIVAGVWCLVGLDMVLSRGDGGSMMLIKHPMITIGPTLVALVILVTGGLLAGYYPTRRALKVKAIEALREE